MHYISETITEKVYSFTDFRLEVLKIGIGKLANKPIFVVLKHSLVTYSIISKANSDELNNKAFKAVAWTCYKILQKWFQLNKFLGAIYLSFSREYKHRFQSSAQLRISRSGIPLDVSSMAVGVNMQIPS